VSRIWVATVPASQAVPFDTPRIARGTCAWQTRATICPSSLLHNIRSRLSKTQAADTKDGVAANSSSKRLLRVPNQAKRAKTPGLEGDSLISLLLRSSFRAFAVSCEPWFRPCGVKGKKKQREGSQGALLLLLIDPHPGRTLFARPS
jgi:hypothetical protein